MTSRNSFAASTSLFALTAACLLPIATAEAGYLVAFDSAADSVYAADWQTGQNGGTGFGAWTISDNNSNNFAFVAASTTNGSNPSLGIDTAGRSWGMRSNAGGAVVDAVRSFNNPLEVGGKISLDFDNGFVDASGTTGFGLRNANGDNLMEFLFTGGNANYSINDTTTNFNTGLGFTDDGLHLELTRTGTSTYALEVTDLGASSILTFNRVFSTVADFSPAQIRFFNFQTGGGDAQNSFFNSVSIEAVPEPATSLLVGLGLIAVASRRRRRNG